MSAFSESCEKMSIASHSREAAPAMADLKDPGGNAFWRHRYDRVGYLYILPALVLFVLMVAWPIIRSFTMSFYDYSILEPDSAKFVGLDNYAKLFHHGPDTDPIKNTLYFALVFVPPYVILALLIGIMLNNVRRGSVFLRTMIFTPVVVSLAVSAVMWTLFYNATFGLAQVMWRGIVAYFNFLPFHLGFISVPFVLILGGAVMVRRLLGKPVNWLSTVAGAFLVALVVEVTLWMCGVGRLASLVPGAEGAPWGPVIMGLVPAEGMLGSSRWAMIAIAVMCLWNGIGINIILFLVGLQRIPDDLYEAAVVDGASPWQQFWHVTVPQLMPTIYLVVLLSLIGAFKVFGQPYIMTGGGPADSTMTYVMRLYNLAFRFGKFELGYASALAYALALFIVIMSAFVRKLNRPVD